MITKKMYEEYLNTLDPPAHDHPDNGGRVSWRMVNKYGTWLRKYDPIAFEIGYNEILQECQPWQSERRRKQYGRDTNTIWQR